MATTTVESRVSRLEGAYEQVDKRLDDLQRSINTQTIVIATVALALVGLNVAQLVIR